MANNWVKFRLLKTAASGNICKSRKGGCTFLTHAVHGGCQQQQQFVDIACTEDRLPAEHSRVMNCDSVVTHDRLDVGQL